MRAGTARERLSRRSERVADGLLDFAVLAFASWTAIYHTSLVLGLGALVAAAAAAVALVPCAWLAARRDATERVPAPGEARRPRRTPAHAAGVALAAAAAALFAFGGVPWRFVWLLWVAAAAAALALTMRRETGQGSGSREPGWTGAVVALAWAAGLATLSLFLVRPSADDAQYVRLSSWVAAHGEFPRRDVLFSEQALPAIIFPPLSSFEALAGTVARAAGLAVPDVVYLAVPALATALSVLAIWRLLRAWRVPMVALALSVALVFLVLGAEGHRSFGNFFVGRMWQGKVVFLAVLVPLLFALLADYVERPTTRRLALLAAAGAAGVGLTTTGVFLVPVVALGCLAPLALRAPRQAALGLAAAASYPLAAGVATLAVGGRNAAVYTEADVVPGNLVHVVLGEGVLALLAVGAVLVAPLLVPLASAARMAAGTALVVGCLYAPLVPLLIFRLTGLGEVQWRWVWALPVAPLVGVLAAALGARIRARALRAAPAALLCAAFAVWGTPVWATGGMRVAEAPAWKLSPETVALARRVLAEARPGDTVLAERRLMQTLLVLSGEVTVVAPRSFYTRALRDVPGGHARARLRLLRFAEHGLGRVEGTRRVVRASGVSRALRRVDVDLACVPAGEEGAHRFLVAAGYEPALADGGVSCLRERGAGAAPAR